MRHYRVVSELRGPRAAEEADEAIQMQVTCTTHLEEKREASGRKLAVVGGLVASILGERFHDLCLDFVHWVGRAEHRHLRRVQGCTKKQRCGAGVRVSVSQSVYIR